MICNGCRDGLPLVQQGLLLDAGVSSLPPGWRACMMGTGFHAPSTDAAEEIAVRAFAPPPPGELKIPRGEPATEKDVRRDVRAVLSALGYLAWDFEQGYRADRCRWCDGKLSHSTRVPLGVPDLYVLGHGFGFWCELKHPARARRTADQEARAAELRDHAGSPCYLITSPLQVVMIDHFRAENGRLPSERELASLPEPEIPS